MLFSTFGASSCGNTDEMLLLVFMSAQLTWLSDAIEKDIQKKKGSKLFVTLRG